MLMACLKILVSWEEIGPVIPTEPTKFARWNVDDENRSLPPERAWWIRLSPQSIGGWNFQISITQSPNSALTD